MNRNYLMIDLHDPRSALITEVLSNKTAKRVLALLAEEELSQTELARTLSVPASTIDYTMKKLVRAGLVEPVRSLWSSKGKKVPIYRVSNKKIVISPKILTKGVIPALVASLVGAGILKVFFPTQSIAPSSALTVASKSAELAVASDTASAGTQMAATTLEASSTLNLTDYYGSLTSASPIWAWFLLGSLTALVVFLLWNWGKHE